MENLERQINTTKTPPLNTSTLTGTAVPLAPNGEVLQPLAAVSSNLRPFSDEARLLASGVTGSDNLQSTDQFNIDCGQRSIPALELPIVLNQQCDTSSNFRSESVIRVSDTGVTRIPDINNWLTDNFTFSTALDQLPSTTGVYQGEQVNIFTNLKNFDNILVKLKKTQLEISYFQECLKLKIVPKGLRHHQYPTGLVVNSQFHKDLLVLFDRQGFELLNLMIKHYAILVEALSRQVSELDETIKLDSEFVRYKYEYNRIFSSIEQYLGKLKNNKTRKIDRDLKACKDETAYPKPPSAQVWQPPKRNVKPVQPNNGEPSTNVNSAQAGRPLGPSVDCSNAPSDSDYDLSDHSCNINNKKTGHYNLRSSNANFLGAKPKQQVAFSHQRNKQKQRQ